MEVGGPEAAAFDGGPVSHERVEPDIENVAGVVGDGDAPLDGCAADREVLQLFVFEEGEDFVAAGFGLKELRIVFVQLDQLVLKGGEFKEEVFFGD